jgi:hypothetical protein
MEQGNGHSITKTYLIKQALPGICWSWLNIALNFFSMFSLLLLRFPGHAGKGNLDKPRSTQRQNKNKTRHKNGKREGLGSIVNQFALYVLSLIDLGY